MLEFDIAIIGGGPAGLAAAVSAYENGCKSIALLERDTELGGILNQCIHNGFGLHRFGMELTGPEYAGKYIEMLKDTDTEIFTGAMVINLSQDRVITAVSRTHGYFEIKAKAVILAMGCRERSRGAISVPGDRGSGIFTAGTAQRYLNMEGYMVGKRIVILGSGDIGLIMARRMTLEGAKVLAVAEIMPHAGGLSRNIAQCLDDFEIPLYLSHTITDIRGKARIEGVTMARIDENRVPIKGTEIDFECDTLLLSVGLIPENELSRGAGIKIDPRTNGAYVDQNMQTTQSGVFACGNALHVHDLVDFVSEESAKAGKNAVMYSQKQRESENFIEIKNGNGISYTVPQRLCKDELPDMLEIFLRVRKKSESALIEVSAENGRIAAFKREFLAPGEMQKLRVPKKLLDNAVGDLTVSLIEQ